MATANRPADLQRTNRRERWADLADANVPGLLRCLATIFTLWTASARYFLKGLTSHILPGPGGLAFSMASDSHIRLYFRFVEVAG